MKLNRKELRKIIYDFNSVSNRLLQADYNDHANVVYKFVSFIKSTPIIYEYVQDCGVCTKNMDNEFSSIASSYGRKIFDIGITDEEEVCNVFAIMEYIAEKQTDVSWTIAEGYTTSSKFQDRTKAFNNRVVMVLIRHIESYLTKVGIDMGVDEKVTYSINVKNGQVNIASDNASITASNSIGIDNEQLNKLIGNIMANSTDLSDEDSETLTDSLEVIKSEIVETTPKKSMIKTAIAGLKAIKGTAELGAAIAALVQFIQPLL